MRTDEARIRRGYADTPRGQIHYAEAGAMVRDGQVPLILMGATPRTHRCFLRLMALLAPKVHTIAIDLPGFGQSHGLPEPLTIPAIAECVVDFLDAKGLARVDVFGLHTGNKVAAALAVLRPDRVERLILAGQSHSIIADMQARNAVLQPWFNLYKTHFEPSADGAHLVREWLGANANINTIWWPPKLLNGRTVERSDIENAEARAIDFVLGWRSAVAVYEAIFAYDLADAYRHITRPTLVLEMRTTKEAQIAGQAEQVCKLIANAKPASIVEMDGLGLEMRPQEFADPILSFLGSNA